MSIEKQGEMMKTRIEVAKEVAVVLDTFYEEAALNGDANYEELILYIEINGVELEVKLSRKNGVWVAEHGE